MSDIMSVKLINNDGEIISERTFRKYNPFQDGKGYNFKYKSAKIKSYLDIGLPNCFNDSEVGKIYRLSRDIYSNTNLLAKRSSNNIVPLNKQEVQTMLNMHRNKFNPFWHKLFDNKVIKTVLLDNQEYFCFNPLYFNSTDYLPLYLFLAFQSELQNHLPEWVIEKYLDMT